MEGHGAPGAQAPDTRSVPQASGAWSATLPGATANVPVTTMPPSRPTTTAGEPCAVSRT